MAIETKTEKRAHAVWEGDLAEGSGRVSVGSGTLGDQPVSWAARTEHEDATSPEELIAAALASCFSMALSNGLAQAGNAPTKLETDARATFEKTEAGFRMTQIALTVRGEVDGIDEEGFQKAAEEAKDGCPVSNALKGNVDLSVDAALSS
jgi:osmotically inducible protein OsmC